VGPWGGSSNGLSRQADAERLRGLVAAPSRHGVLHSSRWVIAKMT
jgi:hypothetical protein